MRIPWTKDELEEMTLADALQFASHGCEKYMQSIKDSEQINKYRTALNILEGYNEDLVKFAEYR